MAKIWNPKAKRASVHSFVRDWCVLESHRLSQREDFYQAYVYYCRNVGIFDLTQGEFDDEMDKMGFSISERHGEPAWQGIGLTLMEDAFIHRTYGVRASRT